MKEEKNLSSSTRNQNLLREHFLNLFEHNFSRDEKWRKIILVNKRKEIVQNNETRQRLSKPLWVNFYVKVVLVISKQLSIPDYLQNGFLFQIIYRIVCFTLSLKTRNS